MANFAIDPMLYVPAGHHIIDGGVNRLPRTFVSPPSPMVRSHERFLIAEVMPAPPLDQMGQVREQVVELINHMGFHVRSAQPWISGVGLLRSEMLVRVLLWFRCLLKILVWLVLFVL